MHKESDISWIIKKHETKNPSKAKEMFPEEAAKLALRLHSQMPGYEVTRLAAYSNLAKMLGVGGIFVKNEGERMELNSFKVMGGSFALFKYFQDLLNLKDDQLSFDYLTSDDIKKKVGKITFASATDGNHGRGVAWASQMLGHDCQIYVHEETSQPRIDAIAEYGAKVTVVKGNYDDAVRQCSVDAGKNGWEVISDTSWDGYTKVPTRIMQGYTTMLQESQKQLNEKGIKYPTHVFVQAGVGALAAAVIGFYTAICDGVDTPKFVVVEPDKAGCIFVSAKADDGEPHTVGGSLSTIMAGLACGEPSPLAWEILKQYADVFMEVPDYVAARGMRVMANPLEGDPTVISGESGAVTLGALYQLLSLDGNKELKDFLALDESSNVLFINTEGDTDPISFRQIVWDGANHVPEEYLTQK